MKYGCLSLFKRAIFNHFNYDSCCGDVEISIPTLTTGLITPASGTNIFWNYTGVVINATATPQSSTYTAVSAAPNSNLFPAATIASTSDNMHYNMYKYGTAYEDLGSASPTASDCVVYSNPTSLYGIPFSYGNVLNDTHGYSTSTETVTGTTNSTANGTGTLALPGYTFSNVLMLTVNMNRVTDGSMTSTVNIKFQCVF